MAQGREPGAIRQLTRAAIVAHGPQVVEREPDPSSLTIRRHPGGPAAQEMLVGQHSDVDACTPDEFVGRREAVIALDELEAPVARVALELHGSQPSQPHAAAEAKPGLRDVGAPVRELVGAEPEMDGVPPQLPFREVEQRLPVAVDVGVVRAVAVVASRHDLGCGHLKSQRRREGDQIRKFAHVVDDEHLAAEVPSEQVRVQRLQRAGKADPLRRDSRVRSRGDGHGSRGGDPGAGRKLEGALLVEHGEEHVVVGLDGHILAGPPSHARPRAMSSSPSSPAQAAPPRGADPAGRFPPTVLHVPA